MLSHWITAIDDITNVWWASGSPASVDFTSLLVEGVLVRGSWQEWALLTSETISTQRITSIPHRLVVMWAQTPDPADLPWSVAECADQKAVREVVDRLQYWAAQETLSASNATIIQCQNTAFVVGRCAGSTTAFLCVDCSSEELPCAVFNTSHTAHTGHCGIHIALPTTPAPSLVMLHLEFKASLPVPQITSMQVTPSSDSLGVELSLDQTEGFVTCQAFPSAVAYLPTDLDIFLWREASGRLRAVNTTVSLTDLQPATSYDVYCATYSDIFDTQSLQTVLSSKRLGVTACCRTVQVALRATSFVTHKDVPSALTVRLAGPVSSRLTLLLGATRNGLVMHPFSQQNITFIPTSPLQQSVAFLRQSPGLYQLQMTASGPDASNYQVVYADSQSFTVISPIDTLPPPTLQSAAFSEDGLYVLVGFSAATNRAGYTNTFPCGTVFSLQPQVDLSFYRCLWVSDTTVRMLLPSTSRVGVGDTLNVRKGVLTAKCSLPFPCAEWAPNEQHTLPIARPLHPLIPTPSMLMPSQVGPCDAVRVDTSSSRGSGGRPFANVTFTVTTTPPSANASRLANFLQQSYSEIAPLTIPAHYLSAGSAYGVTLMVCNFLGTCGQVAKSLVVTSGQETPVLLMDHAVSAREVKASAPLVIRADAYVTACGGGGRSRNHLQFKWRVLDISGNVVDVSSSSSDPHTFWLRPYSLIPGQSYTVRLEVKHTLSLRAVRTAVSVKVARGSVVAVITDGLQRLLHLNNTLTIDASKSYDQDNQAQIGVEAGLSFTFAIVQMSPAYLAPSPLILTPTSSPARVTITSPMTAALINTEHIVTVTVSHAAPYRVVSTDVYIKVLPPQAPLISLQSQSSTRVNPTHKLVLVGALQVSASADVQWSVDDSTIDLTTIAVSPIRKSIPYAVGGQYSHFVSLVLPPHSLPASSSFTFNLQCSTALGIASSSISITTNDPPKSGSYVVTPTSGTMLSTVFSFLAVKWEDSDRPITYEFAYESMSGNKYLVHRGRREVSSASSELPQGMAEADFGLRTRLQVFDALDGKAEEYVSVTVQRIDFSVEDTEQYLHTALSASSGYVSVVTDVLAKTIFMVNSVKCDSAPNCSALYRSHCRDVAHTCGHCRGGYVGEAGQANTQCFPLHSTAPTRRLALLDASATIAQSSTRMCAVDRDCSSTWQQCVSGTCVVESKKCSGSCSGKGRCVFVSRYDSNTTFSTCSVLQDDCLPRCVCEPGYNGRLCEYTSQDFNTTQQMRHTLIRVLQSVMDSQVITADALISWLQTLASVSGDARGLDAHTQALVTTLAMRILREGAALGMSYEEFTAVRDILDLVLLEEGSDVAALQLSNMYNQFILADIVTGQHQVDVSSVMFRASFFAANSLNGTVVGVAPAKRLGASVAVQSVQLQSTSQLVAVSVSETLGNSSAYESHPLGVTFNGGLPCNDSPSQPSVCTIDITLALKPDRRRLSPTPSGEERVHAVQCVEGINSTHTFPCADDIHLTLHCNGTHGSLSKRCPRKEQVPHCASLSPVGGPCHVLSATRSTVTCRCVLPASGTASGRRLQKPSSGGSDGNDHDGLHGDDAYSDDSQISMDYAVVMKAIVTDFTETWSSASTLDADSVSENIQVLITVGALGVVGVLAVLGSVQLDRRDESKTQRTPGTSTGKRTASPGQVVPVESRDCEAGTEMRLAVPTGPGGGVQRHVSSVSDALLGSWSRVMQVMGGGGAGKVDTDTVSNVVVMSELKKIEDSLPMVLRPLPLSKKFFNELRVHQR